ncbi:hypothetical protein ES319_D06G093700v1 [Gossypium barbadense]|uniref:FAE domain-containing protein n=2 Tax=Gossypium TaxID=3633 RepID=A0A5J5R164_GOSBA|nr:hypothetical protein ES319_D06G093700v1 [Gossypium barbadense]TYG64347.1 hypothetical protein ES288_D06G100600v1 [Gossypium darwinii]
MSGPRSIYLIDFACFRPHDDLKVTKEQFIEMARASGKFDEASLQFQKRIVKSSGVGDETYLPKAVMSDENSATMKEGRLEASTVMFGALDELFEKTRIRPKDVGVLVVNCSIFNPTPSLSAMIINHYKMRGNVLSYNLGGMGCSAGLIAVDLSRDMLQANPNNYAVVVNTEMVGYNWYPGRTGLCLFRIAFSGWDAPQSFCRTAAVTIPVSSTVSNTLYGHIKVLMTAASGFFPSVFFHHSCLDCLTSCDQFNATL